VLLASCLSLKQICGAIQEYQTQLIDSVKDDIKHLHEKVGFLFHYTKKYHI
jgi:dynein heavy chain 1